MRGLVIIWRYGKCGNCSIDASTKYFYKNNFVTFYQSYGKQQRNTLSHTSVLKLTYRWPISLAPPLIILTPAVKYFRLVACSMFYLLIGVWCRPLPPLRAVVSRLYRGQAPGQEPASTSIWKDTGQCRAQSRTQDTEEVFYPPLPFMAWLGWWSRACPAPVHCTVLHTALSAGETQS